MQVETATATTDVGNGAFRSFHAHQGTILIGGRNWLTWRFEAKANVLNARNDSDHAQCAIQQASKPIARQRRLIGGRVPTALPEFRDFITAVEGPRMTRARTGYCGSQARHSQQAHPLSREHASSLISGGIRTFAEGATIVTHESRDFYDKVVLVRTALAES
jgi:hypothetical protein